MCLLLCFCWFQHINGQQRIYTVANAHAHNDYKHPHPFTTAYEASFGSIEVDIFFRNNQLLVAHDTAEILPGNTLQKLYLDPLSAKVVANFGQVYKDVSKELILLIDVKEEPISTLQKLMDILKDYPALTNSAFLKVVITGNQPAETLLPSYPFYLYFDGNLGKTYTHEALKKIALFSDNFQHYSEWKGKGLLPHLDRLRLDSAVAKAHSLNKPIRFWGGPDGPAAWHQFIKLDADFINTDQINQLSIFLEKQFGANSHIPVSMLGDVMVTTQRTAQVNLQVPYSTQTVSQKALQQYQSRTTPEALMGVNGVFVQKTNHGGGSPFIRGLTGNQTLLLVDGIRLNNATYRYGPNQYLNTIDPYTIGKIEVAKGTGSVQYGSDAIGGALQVFTKEPQYATGKAGWAGNAAAKYMTGDMEKTVRGEAAYTSAKTAVIAGVTYRNFGDLIGGDTTGKQSPSGYKEYAFDAKAKFQIKPSVELIIANQFVQQQHVPVYHKVVLENFALNEFDPQQRMLNYAKLHVTNRQAWMQKLEVIASWQQTIEGRNSRKNGSNTLRKERDEVNTLGFTVDVASRFTKAWTANSGIELYNDGISSTRNDYNGQTNAESFLRGLYPDNSRYGNYAAYSLHHLAFNKFIVESGIRYNAFSISLTDTTLGKVHIKPASFVYNASLLYKLTTQQSIYINYNTAFRAPNIDDLGTLGIVDFRYEIPTSNLKPERSINTEVGYKIQAGKWSGGASAYYMHLSNLITRIKVPGQVINGYPVYKKENVEEGFIKGFETTLAWQPFTHWSTKGSVAYTYGQSLSKNEPLRRIPPFNGRLLQTYEGKKWFASFDVMFAGKQDRLAAGDKDDNRIPAGGTPGWTVCNLFSGIQLNKVNLNAGLQNIFDVDYRTHGSGINGVGRSAWISVMVSM